MKKKHIKAVGIALASLFAFSAAACNNNTLPNEPESNVAEVKAVVAGYGVDWLTAAAAKFNEMYAEEGYEIRITLTDTEINAQNEITTPNKNTADLYFEYNNIDNLIDRSRNILKETGASLLEDLTDVYTAKAIGEDKQEQGKPIGERLDSRAEDFCSYTGVLSGYDGVYALPTQGGTTGLYVNMKTLREKGYTSDDLLTTDALLNMVEELAPADPLDTTAFFPVAWSGLKAPGYWNYLCQILIAQYTGATRYENIWNFVPANGTVVDQGYTVYQERGIYEALKVTEELENRDYAVPGTTSLTHTAAQARVFKGESLMMVSGDWIYKEMEKDYPALLDDVIAVKTPVISALGVKLGLCGTAHAMPDKTSDDVEIADVSCDACETKLLAIVKAVDEGTMTDAEIASAQGVGADKVATIRASRGYYQGSTCKAVAFIPSYSNAKKVAKLFLRFLMSDDGNAIYNEHTYSYFDIQHITPLDPAEMNEREKAVYDKMYDENSSPVYEDESSRLRSVANVAFYPQEGTLINAYTGLSYSHSNGKPTFTAKSIYEGNIKYARLNWQDWLQAARLI